MDNWFSSGSGNTETGATSTICVPLLAGTVLFCAVLNCTPPVRIRVCFPTCFSVLRAPHNLFLQRGCLIVLVVPWWSTEWAEGWETAGTGVNCSWEPELAQTDLLCTHHLSMPPSQEWFLVGLWSRMSWWHSKYFISSKYWGLLPDLSKSAFFHWFQWAGVSSK